MGNGGQAAIRGYLVQTLIALLDALDDERAWLSVTLEPNVESEKVDILWESPESAKAVQVKSSQNPFGKADVQRWADRAEILRDADEYELVLVGTPASAAVARIKKVGAVAVPSPKNLDLRAFSEQASHRLEGFLRKHDLDPGDAHYRLMLAAALTEKLATLSTAGRKLTRPQLLDLLGKWIPPMTKPESRRALPFDTVQLIKVFVSSPDNVSAEHAALNAAIRSINRTDGQAHGYLLELLDPQDAVPQIGPGRQRVLDGQRPPYDIYLGIMSTRFGDPTGRYGSGTEKEFEEALENWNAKQAPWITFYFQDEPAISSKPADVEQYLKVCRFRERLQTMGLVGTYKDVRGSNDSLYEKVSEHLRKIAARVLKDRKSEKDTSKENSTGPAKPPLGVPQEPDCATRIHALALRSMRRPGPDGGDQTWRVRSAGSCLHTADDFGRL